MHGPRRDARLGQAFRPFLCAKSLLHIPVPATFVRPCTAQRKVTQGAGTEHPPLAFNIAVGDSTK
jgi:hypothetical protein